MKKEDVENVLEKSCWFWKDNLKKPINLVDIYALADKIWRQLQFDYNIENELIEFTITKSQLLNLEKYGDAYLETDTKDIFITFIDDTELISITESGKIYISGKEKNNESVT